MPVLKSLSFTALPKSTNDPVQSRRSRFITKLEEQKLLLKDPNHVRTVQRWTKVNGERQATTKQQAVRPWWKTDPSGQVVMSVKFGAKPLEFAKGRPTALGLSIVAATYSTWVFNRKKVFDRGKLRPLLLSSLPTALIGGHRVGRGRLQDHGWSRTS